MVLLPAAVLGGPSWIRYPALVRALTMRRGDRAEDVGAIDGRSVLILDAGRDGGRPPGPTSPCAGRGSDGVRPGSVPGNALRTLPQTSSQVDQFAGRVSVVPPARQRDTVGVVRHRALVHVAGPPAAGKTTFVEAVLAHAGQSVMIAARCRRDHALTEPRETRPKTDPELGRYRAAGAVAVARYDFPDAGDAHDSFFITGLMDNYSNGVLLEGDSPLVGVDISVYVAPAAGGRLLVRRKANPAQNLGAGVDALQAVLHHPDGLALLMGELLGDHIAQFARGHPELVEQQRLTALAELDRLRRAPAPRAPMRWAIAEQYRGIEHAQLVVVNIRGQAERDSGEVLLAEVARLRTDQAVFDDVMGLRGSKVPITAVAANLADPKDPGTKKALARVRRVLRPNL